MTSDTLSPETIARLRYCIEAGLADLCNPAMSDMAANQFRSIAALFGIEIRHDAMREIEDRRAA